MSILISKLLHSLGRLSESFAFQLLLVPSWLPIMRKVTISTCEMICELLKIKKNEKNLQILVGRCQFPPRHTSLRPPHCYRRLFAIHLATPPIGSRSAEYLIGAWVNPRPAGVFGRSRPAGGGEGGRFCPPLPNSRTRCRSEVGEVANESSR